MAENLAALPPLTPGQKVIGTFDKPVKATGHIAVLQGNLAPEFAVGKITGKEGTRFQGPARCFDEEEAMMRAVEQVRVTTSLYVFISIRVCIRVYTCHCVSLRVYTCLYGSILNMLHRVYCCDAVML